VEGGETQADVDFQAWWAGSSRFVAMHGPGPVEFRLAKAAFEAGSATRQPEVDRLQGVVKAARKVRDLNQGGASWNDVQIAIGRLDDALAEGSRS
jgi:hypothetical protein